MRSLIYSPISAALLLGFVGGNPAIAQTQNAPWVQMQTTAINLGIGGQSGDGMLYLPNLGTNCSYPFTVHGFGAGIRVGVSVASASGVVRNMIQVADLAGGYHSTQGEATLIAGGGVTSMKNQNNNVIIDVNSQTKGLALGVGAQGMTIEINAPIPNASHSYIMEFGFDKTWLNRESRAILDQVIAAWKCHYVNFRVVGYSDTVGKEDDNLQLAAKRAQAVRDYLVGAGVVPTRITVRAASEHELLVPTGEGVRLRANRAVVLAVTN